MEDTSYLGRYGVMLTKYIPSILSAAALVHRLCPGQSRTHPSSTYEVLSAFHQTFYRIRILPRKKSEDEEVKDDLNTGCEAAERVLLKANEAVNRDLLDEALEELITRVDDWKSHKVESFGKLLLHGVYGVITGKSDQEKDVRNGPIPCSHREKLTFC